jgi:MoxR-like ATPase
VEPEEVAVVNAALYLRRPLLVTGSPGTGKSTLAQAVAHELDLGDMLVWPITSRATLKEALYSYDAIGRLQSSGPDDIGEYIWLGPLGTAFADSEKPRVLLIDEIDKSDIDLPNDLLHIFESGQFVIPELARHTVREVAVYAHGGSKKVNIVQGRVICQAFPFVVLTSNGERELPAPFLRRCLHLEFTEPDSEKLSRIVAAHFGQLHGEIATLVDEFIENITHRREQHNQHVATDQLLNAVYLLQKGVDLQSSLSGTDSKALDSFVLQTIGEIERK